MAFWYSTTLIGIEEADRLNQNGCCVVGVLSPKGAQPSLLTMLTITIIIIIITIITVIIIIIIFIVKKSGSKEKRNPTLEPNPPYSGESCSRSLHSDPPAFFTFSFITTLFANHETHDPNHGPRTHGIPTN